MNSQSHDNERKKTEQMLKRSEEKYKMLFDLSPTPMWIADIDTLCFLDVNEAAVRQYGYSRDEFLNMTIDMIRPEEDLAMLHDAMTRIRACETLYSKNEYRHRKKDGEVIHARIESSIVDLEGRKALIILATDITDQKGALKQVSDMNEKLITAQQIANLGYWTNDLKNNIQWSDELYRIFEQDPATFDVTFDKLVELFHPDDRHLLLINVDSTFVNGFILDFESRVVTGKGNLKWLHNRLRLVLDSNGKPLR